MSGGMKAMPPSDIHRAARDAMVKAMGEFPLTPIEMLALTAQLVGNLIAYQDQRELTAEDAMGLVSANIVEGNEIAIRSLTEKFGGRA